MPEYYDKKTVNNSMKSSKEATIRFKNVHFRYPTKKDVPVLHNFNLEIETNQVIALVGHSGCGKSSTIALIERFYDPTSGSVYFNDSDLKDIDMCWYHQ